MSLNVDYSISNSDYTGINYSETNTYTDGSPSGTELVNQRYEQREDSYSASADLTYTEPLGRNFFLLGSYRFNWSNSQTEKDTRDILEDGTVSQEIDSVYSSRMENTFLRHRMQVSFMKQEKCTISSLESMRSHPLPLHGMTSIRKGTSDIRSGILHPRPGSTTIFRQRVHEDKLQRQYITAFGQPADAGA